MNPRDEENLIAFLKKNKPAAPPPARHERHSLHKEFQKSHSNRNDWSLFVFEQCKNHFALGFTLAAAFLVGFLIQVPQNSNETQEVVLAPAVEDNWVDIQELDANDDENALYDVGESYLLLAGKD